MAFRELEIRIIIIILVDEEEEKCAGDHKNGSRNVSSRVELINQPNIYEYYGHSTTWLLHKFANQKLQFWLPQFMREREGVRERRLRECGLTKQWAKYIFYLWLSKLLSGEFHEFRQGKCVCVWVCCVCACFCLQARASKITIISGANTHTHRQTLTKSDWKFRQDTERHRKLLPVVSKLEYTSGIVSKRVENSLLMSFNGYYICTC